ncbi:MAG: hypothetical protein WA634_02345 [Silvibacterium sp.]
MSSVPIPQIDDSQLRRLVCALDSLTDGNLAVDLLVACGERAIAPLEESLLRGAPRTIALPRCRAARALGALGAYKTLLAYFEKCNLPSDPVVLFAEDAVRSTVAHELLRWKSEEVFQTLLRASIQRVTIGMIEALGEFQGEETIPLLFKTLEDDLCRNAAMDALRKTPKQTVDYAILSLREKTEVSLIGPAASRRRRATSALLRTLGISREEWQEMRGFLLEDEDAEIVVNAAAAGFRVASPEDFPRMIQALFRVADKLNCLQEDEVVHLLEEHRVEASHAAMQIVSNLNTSGKHGSWLSPTWRILWHLGCVNN